MKAHMDLDAFKIYMTDVGLLLARQVLGRWYY